uniref:Sodium/potassium ATPase subunit beta n=1 Tax=Wuchereria bancrofti TaxID=6293 RepID=A0AAF5PIY9_WUCBA
MGDQMNKEQQERLMNGRGKAIKIFNKDKGTCLERTAKSWIQILAFYLVFYSLLIAFWIGCLAIFLFTLDEKVPRYYGKGTIIGVNPGVGYQPWLLDDPDSTLIRFNIRDKSSYQKYVNTLDKYLSKYSNLTATRKCIGDQSNAQLFMDGSARPEILPGDDIVKSCRFELAKFSGAGCGKNTSYGFSEGKPCVILTLNRLIGWMPIDYAPDSVPEIIKERYKPNFVTLKCDGTSDIDKEHVGNVKYIPEAGIDGKYYPYVVMPNYQQPFAMIKFDNLPRNKVVLIECRAYAQNVEIDITSKLGMVNFEVMVQDVEPEKPIEQSR